MQLCSFISIPKRSGRSLAALRATLRNISATCQTATIRVGVSPHSGMADEEIALDLLLAKAGAILEAVLSIAANFADEIVVWTFVRIPRAVKPGRSYTSMYSGT